MWHFVLLWLTCDALIIQRYVKIMTPSDLWVSFHLLVVFGAFLACKWRGVSKDWARIKWSVSLFIPFLISFLLAKALYGLWQYFLFIDLEIILAFDQVFLKFKKFCRVSETTCLFLSSSYLWHSRILKIVFHLIIALLLYLENEYTYSNMWQNE